MFPTFCWPCLPSACPGLSPYKAKMPAEDDGSNKKKHMMLVFYWVKKGALEKKPCAPQPETGTPSPPRDDSCLSPYFTRSRARSGKHHQPKMFLPLKPDFWPMASLSLSAPDPVLKKRRARRRKQRKPRRKTARKVSVKVRLTVTSD